MASSTTSEPHPAARWLEGPSPRDQRRLRRDALARRIVSLGGAAIIASILGIFVVIALEVYPLFQGATASPLPALDVSLGSPLAMALDEYREIAFLVSASGLDFVRLEQGPALPPPEMPALGDVHIVAASQVRDGSFAL